MRDFLRRIRLPLVFAALLLLTTTLMVVDRRTMLEGGSDHSWFSGVLIEIATPIQKLIRLPVDLLGGTWTDYIALVDLRRDNETLRSRVAALEEENLQFREALVASGNMERIVQMRENFEVPLLPSEVVGQDVFPWFRSILLDRGRSHEVLSGMPVVSDHGVVGLVTATSPHASRAMMLLDRQSAVDAIIQRSRARGIVRGKGTGELEFVFMVRGDDVLPADVVITSGVGGVYPKGLRIGTIEALQIDEARLLHTGSVRPSVDFGRIEQVFIMLQRGPTMDLLYSGEGDGIGGGGDSEETRPSP
jgi:rod shape-determining protein MreC